jgi:uncharacterized FAD-dependent dehydrogenase
MIYRIHNIRIRPDDGETRLTAEAAKRLGIEAVRIRSLRVRRRSLDARRKPDIRMVYVLDVTTTGEIEPPPAGGEAPPDPHDPFEKGPTGRESLRGPVVVVGAGPAGLAAAWGLARLGYAPLVLERGNPIRQRVDDVGRFWKDREPDPDSNLLFGEGGAGAFSDGKLKTRIGDPLLWTFLNLLVASGAPESILVDANAHLGTDGVRLVAEGLRRKAEELGASFRFGQRLEGIEVSGGRARGVKTQGETFAAGAVVLAPGGSARDTFERLEAMGMALEAKPFQMGLRIEHPQEIIDLMQYGGARRRLKLPPAEYRFTLEPSPPSPGVFSFCMCPGGTIVPAVSEPGRLCTNGMSPSRRDGPLANAALVVTLHPSDAPGGPLGGIALQRRVEERGFAAGGGDYSAPAQTVRAYLEGFRDEALPETSYVFGARPSDLAPVLPASSARAIREGLSDFCRRRPVFAAPPALLLGPETRGSSPVRIVRNPETLVSISHDGVYPAGEGGGYAGGISSAGVDGLRAALAVAARFAPTT